MRFTGFWKEINWSPLRYGIDNLTADRIYCFHCSIVRLFDCSIVRLFGLFDCSIVRLFGLFDVGWIAGVETDGRVEGKR